MLAMVIIGILLVRLDFVSTKDSRVLSVLTAYVLQPALVIHAFQLELTPAKLHGFLFGLGFSLIVFIVWIAAVTFVRNPLHLDAVDQATLIYSNCGNLTLPIVAMTLGEEMVFFVSILTIPFNLFVWTHGVAIIGGKDKVHYKKLLLNPNILGLGAGLVILFSGIPMPDAVDTIFGTLADAVPSISMIVVGMVIGDADLKEIFTLKKAYLILFGRLMILPASTMLLLYFSGILKEYPQYIPVLQVIFMGLSAPPASTVSQLAVIYDENPVEASIYNTVGMFLCIATIPLMNLLYEVLFGAFV